jgi:hypothetical protein
VCKNALLLLADLDCADIRKTKSVKLFHELDRLPLYYCWTCCAQRLSYRVVSRSAIKVFKNEGEPQGEDFPYANFPAEFEKRPARLVRIPYETAKLLAIAQEVGDDWLAAKDVTGIKRRIQNLRHSWFSKSQFNRHQIGGLLNLIQSHERVGCPNPKCKRHKLFEQGYAARMKELAVIHNDPRSGLPMVESVEELSDPSRFNEWVQVVYWVCEECLTIAASNRCD